MKKYILLIVIILCAPNASADSPAEIKVALFNTFSKANAVCYDPYGQYLERGARMAWEEFQRQYPDLKFKVKLKKYDLEDNKLKAIEVVDRAADDDAVAAIGYICSDSALLGGKQAQQRGLPLITPTATHDDLSQIGSYVVMGMFPDSYQGSVLAEFVHTDLKKRKTLIVSAADCSYCLSLAKAYTKRFEALGGIVVDEYHVLASDKDFKDIIEKARRLQFDTVFVPNYGMQSALIVASFLKGKMHPIFIGGDGWNWNDEVYEVIADVSKLQAYFSTSWVPEASNELAKKFLKRHRDLYGEEAFTTTTHCYDAAMVLFHAMRGLQKHDRASVKDALRKHRRYEGLTGTFIYNGKSYPQKTLVILGISGKNHKLVKVLNPK